MDAQVPVDAGTGTDTGAGTDTGTDTGATNAGAGRKKEGIYSFTCGRIM